jgi:hypothetical protein
VPCLSRDWLVTATHRVTCDWIASHFLSPPFVSCRCKEHNASFQPRRECSQKRPVEKRVGQVAQLAWDPNPWIRTGVGR